MLGTSILLIAMLFATPENFSRKGAKAQRKPGFTFAPLRLCGKNNPRIVNDLAQSHDHSIEVFQVLELPLSVHEATLVKSEKKGYTLKLALGNSSEVKIIGLRYSLISIDSRHQAQPLGNRTEGFSISPYTTKTLTFTSPIRSKPRDGERLVIMLEQVISRESIWEVVKAKDAFEAYARGDYSVTPTVLRVSNHVDAPSPRPQQRMFFERY
jgi:hypothetical protein